MEKSYLFIASNGVYNTGSILAALLSLNDLYIDTISNDTVSFSKCLENGTIKILASPKNTLPIYDINLAEECLYSLCSESNNNIIKSLSAIWDGIDKFELSALFLISKLFSDYKFPKLYFIQPKVNTIDGFAIAKNCNISVIPSSEGSSAFSILLMDIIGDFINQYPSVIPDKIGVGECIDNKSCKSSVTVLACEAQDSNENQVVEISCNLDDSTGEGLSFAMELLFNAGAKDVSFTPITMKKNRPGILLTVICSPQKRKELSYILFKHTSTIGLRWCLKNRDIMQREAVIIPTAFGDIVGKRCSFEDINKTYLEYESVKAVAVEKNCPIEDVIRGTYKSISS